ncbi:hypothetical protein MRX96_034865 [Rhipicephalus microplus]
MLPRESSSKEVGAALLTVIGFPAFSITDPELIETTRLAIIEKLQGHYGCKRFLRDGYKTAREDSRRLHYEPWELKAFDNIECEWPLFFCYMIIDACFRGDSGMVDEYAGKLEQLMIRTEEGLRHIPEMYGVPADKVHLESETPHSQARVPVGQVPYMWSQSLFILGRLLQERFLAPGELDPLNRRLCSLKRPEVVVQVVLLAEDPSLQEKLSAICEDIQTGRPTKDVGLLATSKVYLLQDRLFVFSPQNLDSEEFHLVNDVDLFADTICSNISVLRSHWNILGRPTMVVTLQQRQLVNGKVPLSLRQTIKKLSSGYLNGTRVCLGKLGDFISTSCIASLDFLRDYENGNPDSLPTEVRDYLDREMRRTWLNRPGAIMHDPLRMGIPSARSRKSGIAGLLKRSRSITSRDGFDPEFNTFMPSYPTTTSITPHRTSLEEQVPLRAMSELHLDHVAETSTNGPAGNTSGGLVRHFASCLGKRVEDLAKSVTDLLVRQKQVTVGMPPHHEEVINRPLSTKELRIIIARAHRNDQSTAMLTQELLAYLAMFIRTDPHLFTEMLSLRVGLIIQVMAAELARAAKCSAHDTADLLLNLSPFEMKSLLQNILSGRELAAVKSITAVSPGSFAAKCSVVDTFVHGDDEDDSQVVAASCLRVRENCQRPSLSVAEGESERDGSFFSIGDVAASHGSAGRDLLLRLGYISQFHDAARRKSIPVQLRATYKVAPIPRNMDPRLHQGRREARVEALERTYAHKNTTYYVDAANNDHANNKAVATVVDHTLTERTSASVRCRNVTDAEETAIALALALGYRQRSGRGGSTTVAMAYELRFHVIQVVLVWLLLVVHSGRPVDTPAKQLQFPEDCGFSTDPSACNDTPELSRPFRDIVIVRDIVLIKQQKRQQRTSVV